MGKPKKAKLAYLRALLDFHAESIAKASSASGRQRDPSTEKAFSKVAKIHAKAMKDVEKKLAQAVKSGSARKIMDA